MEILIPYDTRVGEVLLLGRPKYEYKYPVTESFINKYYSWLEKGKEEILITKKNLDILLSSENNEYNFTRCSSEEFLGGDTTTIGIYTGYNYNGIYINISEEIAKHIDTDHIKATMVWLVDGGSILNIIKPRLMYRKYPDHKSEDDFII